VRWRQVRAYVIIQGLARAVQTLAHFDREAYSPTFQNIVVVHQRLVGILSEGLQHVGQAAYVRGLLNGHGWLGR